MAQKAEYMETIQARHNRFGLSGGCNLDAFGNIPSCQTGPDDNNGLWSSLIVAAESFRYAVTGAPDALSNATSYFEGMRNLNLVTGITGLMARSFLTPNETQQSGNGWNNSTAPGFEGWQWLGDTSSDEVVGHMFAYSVFAKIMNGEQSPYGRLALDLIYNIVYYIVSNDFQLIDITGLPTTWGRWNPALINWDQDWSDERLYLTIKCMFNSHVTSF